MPGRGEDQPETRWFPDPERKSLGRDRVGRKGCRLLIAPARVELQHQIGLSRVWKKASSVKVTFCASKTGTSAEQSLQFAAAL